MHAWALTEEAQTPQARWAGEALQRGCPTVIFLSKNDSELAMGLSPGQHGGNTVG